MRAVALRHLQRVPEALATLERLEDLHPDVPAAVPGARPLPRLPAAGARGNPGVFARRRAEPRLAGELADARIALPRWSGAGRVRNRGAARGQARHARAAEVVTARSMLADGNLARGGGPHPPVRETRAGRHRGMRVLAQVAHQNEFSKDATIMLEAVLSARPTTAPRARTTCSRCSRRTSTQGRGNRSKS